MGTSWITRIFQIILALIRAKLHAHLHSVIVSELIAGPGVTRLLGLPTPLPLCP